MFNKIVVKKALKRTWGLDNNPRLIPDNPAVNQGSVISQLIYDIFGGEILKTHNKKGWHFYNRINGERIDFTKSKISKSSRDNFFEDLPSNTDEIHNYFEQEQYSTFLIRFIRELEEAIGLKKYRYDFSS
jgi:hypothetical protein